VGRQLNQNPLTNLSILRTQGLLLSNMRRRDVLATMAGTSIAGCSNPLGPSDSGVILNGVIISNYVDKEYVADVVIKSDGEEYLDETFEVTPSSERGGSRAAGGTIVPCEWPNESQQYTVRMRLGDRDGLEVSLPERTENKCEIVELINRERQEEYFIRVTDCYPSGSICEYQSR